MPKKVAAHLTVRIEDIRDLGDTLMAVADEYPHDFRTEMDFYPLVMTYLRGRVPTAKAEHRVLEGSIDFWVGGKNPAAIELAVAPRVLRDHHHEAQSFAGNHGAVRLYASHNKAELKKLAAVPFTQARRRFLLLVDFTNSHDKSTLRRGYESALPFDAGHSAIRVVYRARDPKRSCDFQVGGQKKGRKTAS
ncbi:MAG: hypothetical protein FJ202_01120 [Gemmatimonadetes bacterium]|nr:hypothetical protein [Gemmatimonadota bacterium]